MGKLALGGADVSLHHDGYGLEVGIIWNEMGAGESISSVYILHYGVSPQWKDGKSQKQTR